MGLLNGVLVRLFVDTSLRTSRKIFPRVSQG